MKSDAGTHIVDVLPVAWSNALEFFKAAAASPAEVIKGSLKLRVRAGAEAESHDGASFASATRSERARLDMQRIVTKATGDVLVEKLLVAASDAMGKATANHAAEWLPEGELATDKRGQAVHRKNHTIDA